jgi:hypothetical protein
MIPPTFSDAGMQSQISSTAYEHADGHRLTITPSFLHFVRNQSHIYNLAISSTRTNYTVLRAVTAK